MEQEIKRLLGKLTMLATGFILSFMLLYGINRMINCTMVNYFQLKAAVARLEKQV